MDANTEDNISSYPSQVDSIDDIFQFSYRDLEYVSAAFDQEFDVKFRILGLLDFLKSDAAEIEADNEFIQLIQHELDVIEFSKESRSSVISF